MQFGGGRNHLLFKGSGLQKLGWSGIEIQKMGVKHSEGGEIKVGEGMVVSRTVETDRL